MDIYRDLLRFFEKADLKATVKQEVSRSMLGPCRELAVSIETTAEANAADHLHQFGPVFWEMLRRFLGWKGPESATITSGEIAFYVRVYGPDGLVEGCVMWFPSSVGQIRDRILLMAEGLAEFVALESTGIFSLEDLPIRTLLLRCDLPSPFPYIGVDVSGFTPTEAIFRRSRYFRINRESSAAAYGYVGAVLSRLSKRNQRAEAQALEALRRALQLYGADEPLVCSEMAALFFQKRSYKEALTWYDRVQGPAREEIRNQLNQAICVWKTQGSRKGLDELEKVKSCFPEHSYVYYNLSCVYAELDRIEEAFEALDFCATLGFDRPDVMDKDRSLARIRESPRYQAIRSRL